MVSVTKRYRKVNPGKRRNKSKRKMSPLQKMFFGSKRQRAAVGRKKNRAKKRVVRKYKRRVKRNVSSIVTIWPKGNPGRRKRRTKKYAKRKRTNRGKRIVVINKGVKMARKRRTRRVSHRRKNRSYRRRRNPVMHRRYHRRKRSNPGYSRRRRGNVSHRRHYRRNPGVLSGTAGRIAGVIGGIAVTKLLLGFVPATFSTGIMGTLASAVIAVAQGKLIGKVAKNASLGNDFMVGGLAYTVANLLNQFFPSVGAYSGISGMGLIGGSSFYVPQVNQMGNMGLFQVPSAVSMAMPAPQSAGVGRLRRTGRLM
jgi:hypothetical protein